MPGMGHKHPTWTNELDQKLLVEAGKGKTAVQLSVQFKVSRDYIIDRLKTMGFSGLKDVRRAMTR